MDRKLARTLHSIALEISETIADVRDAESLEMASRQAVSAVALLRALEMMLEPYLSNAPPTEQYQVRDASVPARAAAYPAEHPQQGMADDNAKFMERTSISRGLYSRYGRSNNEVDLPKEEG